MFQEYDSVMIADPDCSNYGTFGFIFIKENDSTYYVICESKGTSGFYNEDQLVKEVS